MKRTTLSHEPMVAIDIGTTKICVLIAQQTSHNSFEILGIGQTPSYGLAKGIVVDINQTTEAIKNAVEEAELMAGKTISSALIGISGHHIQSVNSQGVAPILNRHVTNYDIKQVLAAAQAIPLPEGQQVLHVLPEYFTVDGQQPVKNPLGMHGVRLQAYVHIITGSVACAQNLIKCCQQAGIAVSGIVLEQIASGLAVLSYDERQLGVGILDIGGGTSDLALYQHGGIFFTHVLPVAGNHFTHDIALGARASIEAAEQIKKRYACVYEALLKDESIQITSVQGTAQKTISDYELYSIVKPRAFEMLNFIDQILEKHQLKSRIPAGIVLTGGGSQLAGIDHLAETIFGIPVRLAQPQITKKTPISLQNPMYATGYGLLLYQINEQLNNKNYASEHFVSRLATRMKTWISELF